MQSLAVFSPLEPLKSGCADYTTDLLRELSPHFDITAYVDTDYMPDPCYADMGIAVKPHWHYRPSDAVHLYSVSNNTIHSFVYPYALRHPGLSIMHDWAQYSMVAGYYQRFTAGRYAKYYRDVLWNERANLLWRPMQVRLERRLKRWGAAVRGERRPHVRLDRNLLFPLNRGLVRSAERLVVHSAYLQDRFERLYGRRASLLPFAAHPGTPLGCEGERTRILADHGIPADAPLFISFGIIQPHKRVRQVLEAFAHFRKRHGRGHYLLVGPLVEGFPFPEYIRELDLQDHVTMVTSYVPEREVNRLVQCADLAFNLRWPVYGSSSSTLAKMMAVGCPCVVTNTDTFVEIPDAHVFKVSHGPQEVDDILRLMEMAAAQDPALPAKGAAAAAFYATEGSWAAVGARYRDMIEEIAASQATRSSAAAPATPPAPDSAAARANDRRVNRLRQALEREDPTAFVMLGRLAALTYSFTFAQPMLSYDAASLRRLLDMARAGEGYLELAFVLVDDALTGAGDSVHGIHLAFAYFLLSALAAEAEVSGELRERFPLRSWRAYRDADRWAKGTEVVRRFPSLRAHSEVRAAYDTHLCASLDEGDFPPAVEAWHVYGLSSPPVEEALSASIATLRRDGAALTALKYGLNFGRDADLSALCDAAVDAWCAVLETAEAPAAGLPTFAQCAGKAGPEAKRCETAERDAMAAYARVHERARGWAPDVEQRRALTAEFAAFARTGETVTAASQRHLTEAALFLGLAELTEQYLPAPCAAGLPGA